LEDLEAI